MGGKNRDFERPEAFENISSRWKRVWIRIFDHRRRGHWQELQPSVSNQLRSNHKIRRFLRAGLEPPQLPRRRNRSFNHHLQLCDQTEMHRGQFHPESVHKRPVQTARIHGLQDSVSGSGILWTPHCFWGPEPGVSGSADHGRNAGSGEFVCGDRWFWTACGAGVFDGFVRTGLRGCFGEGFGVSFLLGLIFVNYNFRSVDDAAKIVISSNTTLRRVRWRYCRLILPGVGDDWNTDYLGSLGLAIGKHRNGSVDIDWNRTKLGPSLD